MDLKIIGKDLIIFLKSEQLKYIIFDHTLYDLDDLSYNEETKELWKTRSSQFYAWKFHLKPDIKPGTLFRSINGDIWARFNQTYIGANGNEKQDLYDIDTEQLIMRNATFGNKDIKGTEELLWDKDWYNFVGCLDENSWEKEYPKPLKEGLTDIQLFKLFQNPPLNKSEEEILAAL